MILTKAAHITLIIAITMLTVVMPLRFGYAAGSAEQPAGAVTLQQTNDYNGRDKALVYFAAMGAVGIACIASAVALARIGSAALGAMSERPEIGGRALVYLGLAEGIAIYGLIVAIMMLNKI